MTDLSLDPGFTTPAMAGVLSPAARVASMCRFEAALAAGSADAGVLDREVADLIEAACAEPVADPDAVLRAGWEAGSPVLALLDVLRARLPESARGWLHHGATSQDVVDTAMVLQVRDALALIDRGLRGLAAELREIAVAHRDTPTAAWTFLQPAVPTTVGLRVAGWLSPAVAHLTGVDAARHGLAVQLGGPSGTLDVLAADGPEVLARVAARLDLAVADLAWHTDRTAVAALVGLLERVARTMATIGTDLALLAHHGAVHMRAGRSSSMLGKRNPIDAVRAVAAAEVCSGAASVVTRGRPHELERGIGGWHAEWLAIPLVLHTCAASVEAIARAVGSLEVVATDVDGGPTAASGVFVDRVVAACDRVVPR